MKTNEPVSNQSQGVSIRRRFLSLPTLLAFVIAAAFVLFLATRFDVNWGDTWGNVRRMNPWLYLVGFLLYYLSFAFRGLRWRMLARHAGINPSAGARLPSTFQCARLIIIGWFVNSITWLRLGDAYRAHAFSEDSRGSFSASLGIILAERILDMAIVLALLTVSAAFLSTTSDSLAADYLMVATSALALALSAVVLVMKLYGTRLAQRLSPGVQMAYQRFQQGALGGFKQLPFLVMLGLAGWLLEMARLYFVIQSLDLSVGLPLVPVVALGYAILSTVPTPGGVGVVEPGVTGLLLLGLERHDAVSVALVDRSITYLSVILIGGLVFLHRQVTYARRQRNHALASRQAGEQGEPVDS